MESKSFVGKYSLVIVGVLLFVFLVGINFLFSSKDKGTLTLNDIEQAVKNDLPKLIKIAKSSPEIYGVKEKDLVDVKIYSPVRVITSEYSLNQIVEGEGVGVLHIPIANKDGKIILIFSVVKTKTSVTSGLGVDFAKDLESLRERGVNRAMVCQNKEGIQTYPLNSKGLFSCLEDETSSMVEEEWLLSFPYVSTNLLEENQHLTSLISKGETQK